MTDTPMIQRVRELVHPIASDLDLDVYDIEQRGGTLRVTLDTRPGAPGSVDLEQLSLATRLISRELDHADPVPGRYTLEVTSPGVERHRRRARRPGDRHRRHRPRPHRVRVGAATEAGQAGQP
jgi:ribosome maturation factor RimP